MNTPKDWPDGAWPTPEQLAAWLGRCTPRELAQFAEGILARAVQVRRALEVGAL